MLAAANMLEIHVDETLLRKIQILEAYELGANDKHKTDSKKPCRNAHACAMCKKVCDQRIG